MLNKLSAFIREYNMIAPGDRVICAVSGGADSMALLWGMYLLKEKLGFSLSAAHFNHRLRGAESDRDQQFVQAFCQRFDIALFLGSAQVEPGEKGLEAAAREARYRFLRTLPGTIATAHTADDNAETVLLHLVRGTGLKGLGGITPVGTGLIRPMLMITRQEVEDFLLESGIGWVQDSSNAGDQFLRNRLRHRVMPLLREENPCLSESLSAMALELREDDAFLSAGAENAYTLEIAGLRQMPPALRSRVLGDFLKQCGVREPERSHIRMAQALVFSEKPSARADLPGGVTIQRCYGSLCKGEQTPQWEPVAVNCPGVTEVPALEAQVLCVPAETAVNTADTFTVAVRGQVWLRSRLPGDEMRLPGGSKPLKKLFIDRKIPASQRLLMPVLTDEVGVLGVFGIGADQNRISAEPPRWQFRFEKMRGDF